MIIVYQETVNTNPKNLVISTVTKDLFNSEEEYLQHLQIIARDDIWKHLDRDTKVRFKRDVSTYRLPIILNVF